jgi:phosphate transporter
MADARPQDDFEQFAWTIVFLAMGGIALGRGVTSSGLLESMDRVIRGLVDGLSLYAVVLVLSAVVLVRAYSALFFSDPPLTRT